jgi:WD40 repeat protein
LGNNFVLCAYSGALFALRYISNAYLPWRGSGIGGKTNATADWDETVRLWAIATGQIIHTLVSKDAIAQLWDTATGQTTRIFTGGINSVVFSPNGELIATTTRADVKVRLWA